MTTTHHHAVSGPAKMPAPGLDGTYRDSCVVCFRGTDTGLVFRGEAEWVVAGLMWLGVPEDQAAATLSAATGCDPGKVPVGLLTMPVRVCPKCAKASKPSLHVGVFPDLPCYKPRT